MKPPLVLWVAAEDGPELVESAGAQARAWRRERPGPRVEVAALSFPALWKRLLRLAKGGEGEPGPDVVRLPSHWVPTLAHVGVLHELGELGAKPGLEEWLPAGRHHCSPPGEKGLFSLPWWIEPRVLYFRRDALARAGVDCEVDLADWEGLRRACRRLSSSWRASSGRWPIANSHRGETVSMADLASCVWRRGGELFSADGSRVLFQREDACRGIHDYFQLMAEGWMPVKDRFGMAPKDLFEGGCALQLSGRHPARRRAAAFDLGAAPVPSGGRPGRPALTAAHLAVLSSSRSAPEAYQLARRLALEPGASACARAAGGLPATPDGLAARLQDLGPARSAVEASLRSAQPLPNLRLLGSLERVFERAMERLVGEVVRGGYGLDVLRRELIHAGAEADYLLAMES